MAQMDTTPMAQMDTIPMAQMDTYESTVSLAILDSTGYMLPCKVLMHGSSTICGRYNIWEAVAFIIIAHFLIFYCVTVSIF